jgi:hypothetical protein
MRKSGPVVIGVSVMISLFLITSRTEAQTNSYVLKDGINIAPKYDKQREATAAVRDSVLTQLNAGNFGPLSDDGVVLELTAEWVYEPNEGPKELILEYAAANFKGKIIKSKDNISVVSMARIVPKHSDFSDLAVQELVWRWNQYKERAQRIAEGLANGAPK